MTGWGDQFESWFLLSLKDVVSMFSYCKYHTAAPEAIGLQGENGSGLSEPGLAGASLPKLLHPGWSELTAGVQIHLSTLLVTFNRWARNCKHLCVCWGSCKDTSFPCFCAEQYMVISLMFSVFSGIFPMSGSSSCIASENAGQRW